VNAILAKEEKDSTFGSHLDFLAEPFFFFPFFPGIVFTSWSEHHDRWPNAAMEWSVLHISLQFGISTLSLL